MNNTIKTTNKTILAMFAAVSLLVLVGYPSVSTGSDDLTSNAVESVNTGSNKLKSLMVEPAPDTGFIKHPERQTKRADMPFQKVWIKPDFEKSAYQELLVAPVNTQYMLEMDWLHQVSSANWVSNVKKDIKELAKYFHDRVVQEFRQDLNHRLQVISRPEQSRQQALRLELALIEIDPSTPVLHALTWASPVPGAGTAMGVANQRRAAFEGRLRDLKTGEVVATFADRDTADIGPLDLTRLTWYGPAKGVMDQWARQFVQIVNSTPHEVVTDPTAFTLMPFEVPTVTEMQMKVKDAL
jgi:hypothetical protein